MLITIFQIYILITLSIVNILLQVIKLMVIKKIKLKIKLFYEKP